MLRLGLNPIKCATAPKSTSKLVGHYCSEVRRGAIESELPAELLEMICHVLKWSGVVEPPSTC